MSRTSQAEWRKWAIYGILAWPSTGPMRASSLVHEIEAKGWSAVLPSSGRYDAVHRTLLSLEAKGYAKRIGRPARWLLTENGHDVAHEFVVGNPNVTPERMETEAV